MPIYTRDQFHEISLFMTKEAINGSSYSTRCAIPIRRRQHNWTQYVASDRVLRVQKRDIWISRRNAVRSNACTATTRSRRCRPRPTSTKCWHVGATGIHRHTLSSHSAHTHPAVPEQTNVTIYFNGAKPGFSTVNGYISSTPPRPAQCPLKNVTTVLKSASQTSSKSSRLHPLHFNTTTGP